MGYQLYNHFGYGSVLVLSPMSEKYEEINNDPETYKLGLTPLLIGCEYTGKDIGVALVITESLYSWDDNNHLFLQKIPIPSMDEQISWNYLLADFCQKHQIDFEPPSWAILNWGG
jgi:hypothetical protein